MTTRTRTEQINVRLFKREKAIIRRKAKKAGMNTSAYLRSLGTETVIRVAPKEELKLAYQKLTRLKNQLAYDHFFSGVVDRLSEIEELLLAAYIDEKGGDETDGGDEDLGSP